VPLELRRDFAPSRGARVGQKHANAGDAVTQADRCADHSWQRHERVAMCGQDLLDRLGSHRIRRVAGAPARAAREQGGEQERRDRAPGYGLVTLIVVPLLSPSCTVFGPGGAFTRTVVEAWLLGALSSVRSWLPASVWFPVLVLVLVVQLNGTVALAPSPSPWTS